MNNTEPTGDIQALQLQIETLQLANSALQNQLLKEAEQADLMLRELERQRNELRTASRLQQDLANRTQRVIDAVSSLVFRLDLNGRIVQANQRGLEFLGLHNLAAKDSLYLDNRLSEQDIQSLSSQIPPRPWPIHSILLERVRMFGHYTGHHTLKNSAGEYRQFMVDASVLYDRQGKEEGTVVSAADISELKALERDLRQANAKAESAARSKSEFLANMSHEIRTPMNAIMGLSQLAMNQDLSPQIRDYLEKIKSSSDHLLMVINDILDFSKIEAGGMTIEQHPFGLRRLIANLDGMFRLRAQEKSLELSLTIADDVPDFVQGDPLRIQQILTNLLSNAIKFTDQGRVSLSIRLKESSANRIKLFFSVQDQGIGISAADQEKLFRPFSQAESSISRRFGGTGLGLAISQRLLQMMDGEFQVKSLPGQGSTFSFNLWLPLATEQQATEESRHQINQSAGSLSNYIENYAKALSGTTILVAEDNILNQQVVREFLQMASIRMIFANNGREAIAQLNQHPHVAAILMDVNMPEMSGIAATRIIRQQETHAGLPIIALTAGVTAEERQHCLDAGMNDFVAKPIDPILLLNTLIAFIKPELTEEGAESREYIAQDQASTLQLPGFELDNLYNMLDGDAETMLELLKAFGGSLLNVIERMTCYYAAADMAALRDLAHEVKGTAGNYGAKALFNAAVMLERAAKQHAVSPILLEQFFQQCRETMTNLNALDQ